MLYNKFAIPKYNTGENMKSFWKWYYKNRDPKSKTEANLIFFRTMNPGFVISIKQPRKV